MMHSCWKGRASFIVFSTSNSSPLGYLSVILSISLHFSLAALTASSFLSSVCLLCVTFRLVLQNMGSRCSSIKSTYIVCINFHYAYVEESNNYAHQLDILSVHFTGT